MGDHGDFERVVFEWSEPVEHQVAHRGDQVVVAFGRRGRFDLAPLRERLGHRVVDAWAEGGETTSRVVLRVAPDASVRSFGLKDGRIVVELVRSFARQWVPAGPSAVALELIFTVTDPPVKLLRRVIPVVRIGGVGLDLSIMVLLLVVFILMSVAQP